MTQYENPGAAELDAALSLVDLGTLRATYERLSKFIDDFNKPVFLDENLKGFPILRGILPFVELDAAEFPGGLDGYLETYGASRADSYMRGVSAVVLLLADYIGGPPED